MTYEPTDLRIHRPVFRVRVLLARSTNTEMTNGLPACTENENPNQTIEDRTLRKAKPDQGRLRYTRTDAPNSPARQCGLCRAGRRRANEADRLVRGRSRTDAEV